MRVFEHFPVDNAVCPICHKNHDAACVLLPVAGTADGNIMEAQPTHKLCIDGILSRLVYDAEIGVIYVRVSEGWPVESTP